MDAVPIRELLRELAETPEPATLVDVDRAMSDGRRTVDRRRLVTGSVAALVVCLLAGGYVAVTANLGRPVRTDAVAPSPVAAFNPMRLYADFGWLPDGLDHRTISVGRNFQILAAKAAYGSSSGAIGERPSVGLQVLVAGGAPPDYVNAPLVETEPVNGRPARWVDLRNAGVGDVTDNRVLTWEYAENSWATVTVNHFTGEDPEALARRIASAVRFGLDEAIRLPVRVTVFPPGLTPRVAWLDGVVNRAAGPWEVNICYDGSVESIDCPLEVRVTTPQLRDVPNTTVDGHQATIRTSTEYGGVTLRIYDVTGLDIMLISRHGAADDVPGGLTAIAHGLELFPNPNDWR